MPKKKGKKINGSMKEQMEGLAIAITPVTIEKEKREQYGPGGAASKLAKGTISFITKAINKLEKKEKKLVADKSKILEEASKKHSNNKKIKELKKAIKEEEEYLLKPYEGDPAESRDAMIDTEYTIWDIEGRIDDTLLDLEGPAIKNKYNTLSNQELKVISEKWKLQKRQKNLLKIPDEDDIPFAEGGDVDAQMNDLMPEEAIAPMPEEAQMPDEQMEDEYLDFVVSQSLSPEEETELMNKLEADPALSIMFDKIMDTAMEFSGAGPVEGPGSEVSDSIPARLSDGEFVFTAKATDQIGADRLQSMMEDAEVESDVTERQEIAVGGEVEDEPEVDQYGKPVDEDITAEEIKKSMLSINPRLQ